MCAHAIGGVGQPKHLPVEIMEAVVEPLSSATAVQLHGIGEPLSSPAFWRALENNHFHADCEVALNSNLTLFDARRLRRLMAFPGKLIINVSLDAATAVTYRRIRGFDFDEVTGNIRRLIQARGARSHPLVYMNMTLMHENIEEVVKFVELAHDLGADGVYFWHLNRSDDESMANFQVTAADGWRFVYAEQGLWNYPKLSNGWIKAAVRRGEELAMPVVLDQNKILFYDVEDEAAATDPAAEAGAANEDVSVKDCTYPWEWAVVTSDGDMRPCCFSGGRVGNLNEVDFASAWNGEAMQTLRGDILANRVNALCEGAACKYVQQTRVAPEPVAPEPVAPEPVAALTPAEDRAAPRRRRLAPPDRRQPARPTACRQIGRSCSYPPFGCAFPTMRRLPAA